jgi:hypothetical protein
LGLVALLAGVVVATASALRFTDTPCVEQGGGGIRLCPGAVVDGSYSVTLEGSGGCGPGLPYQYRVLNGSLPPGLSLSKSGTISGRATQAGTYDFWLEISDEDPPSASWCVVPVTAEHEFRIVVSSALSITTKSLPQGASVGQPYSAPLEAMLLTSSSPPAGTVPSNLSWSLASGTMPPGLAIVNGAISGTPTAEGSYTFVVQATLDALRTDIETLTLDVRQPVAIQATKPFAAGGAATRWEVGVPFAGKLNATGGTGAYTWSLATGALPPGMTLAPDGTVSGNPTAAGSFRFTVGLADDQGRTASYPALVAIAPKLGIKTLLLRPGKVGRLYKATLKTTGGVLPTKWKITGRLPRGIRFASKLGVLTGTPKRAGRYRVTVEVTDALKVKSKKTFTLVVVA